MASRRRPSPGPRQEGAAKPPARRDHGDALKANIAMGIVQIAGWRNLRVRHPRGRRDRRSYPGHRGRVALGSPAADQALMLRQALGRHDEARSSGFAGLTGPSLRDRLHRATNVRTGSRHRPCGGRPQAQRTAAALPVAPRSHPWSPGPRPGRRRSRRPRSRSPRRHSRRRRTAATAAVEQGHLAAIALQDDLGRIFLDAGLVGPFAGLELPST